MYLIAGRVIVYKEAKSFALPFLINKHILKNDAVQFNFGKYMAKLAHRRAKNKQRTIIRLKE